MHRGVQSVISWISENPQFAAVAPAAAADELAQIEDALRSPLPSDLRLLLSHCNGGNLPSGVLLRAGSGSEDGILPRLKELAGAAGVGLDDPELPLPYFHSNEGATLAFDRSAAPVADTWPIVDCAADGVHLVHRTFDGWCRFCLAEWTAADFAELFSLDKYLRSGTRHAEIEPDVSAAHATVAHALRRSGQPEAALASYLTAGRCVPALQFCDWEALKLAALLCDLPAALEAGARLASRMPRAGWKARGTTPGQVAEVLGWLVPELDPPDPLLRMLDLLTPQSEGDEERKRISGVRHATALGDSLPPTHPVRLTFVPGEDDDALAWRSIERAYQRGSIRDEDLLLDPAYRRLRQYRPFSELLRIRREF